MKTLVLLNDVLLFMGLFWFIKLSMKVFLYFTLFAYLTNNNSIILSKNELVNICRMLSEPWTGSIWNGLESVLGIRLESTKFFIVESEFVSNALCFAWEKTSWKGKS